LCGMSGRASKSLKAPNNQRERHVSNR
jgi:hypothetical protein